MQQYVQVVVDLTEDLKFKLIFWRKKNLAIHLSI